jgi:hypothetical protein
MNQNIKNMKTTKVTFEVIGYSTQKDFSSRKRAWIEEGLSKAKALKYAKIMIGEDTKVIKVQSSDREFIEIFGETE